MAASPSARSRLRQFAMFRVLHFGCLLAMLLSGVVGCRTEEEIRTYTVPKEASRVTDAKPQAAERLPFDQTPPEGWKAKPPSGFRRAEFQVGEGPGAAEVTVFDFSASAPQMASPLANVNRWRTQEGIGLPPIDETELAKTAEKVTISGKDGIFVAMESPEGVEPRKATLAAMSERDGVVWFFKLHGPRETVLPERERFQEWLDSVEFRE